MIIWMLGVFLIALAAALGFWLGAIRGAVLVVGTILAAALAKAAGGVLAFLVPMMGFRHPIWQFYLPPLLGFIVLGLGVVILAFVVHHLVQKRFRNNTDEYNYARWVRLNRRSGVAVGAGLGAIWLILVALVAYVPGYLTTQLADANESSFSLRVAGQITHAAEATGLQKMVERFQPATPDHYLASDILGLVYWNPALHSRLASYPPFLGLAERPEVAELGRDPEVNTMFQTRAPLTQILEQPKVQAVLDNTEIVNELLALDYQDLYDYLRSGVSEKYREELILGRWRLNVRRSISEMKNVGSDVLPRVELNLLRKALNVFLDEMTVGFTTDHRAIIKVKAKDEQRLLQTVGRASAASRTAEAAPPQVDDGGFGEPPPAVGTGQGLTARSLAARAIPQAPQGYDGATAMDPQLRQRYGLGPGGPQQRVMPQAATAPIVIARAAPPPKPPTTTALGPLMSDGEGSWAQAGDDYTFSLSGEDQQLTFQVRVKEQQLIANLDGRILVFDRM